MGSAIVAEALRVHMDTKSFSLWLHAYSGRENGLMVIGDRDALEALGRQLQSAVPSEARVAPGWPLQVASPSVVGPYKDVRDFRLSFHIKGDSPVEELLPLRRRTWWTPLVIAVAVCAVTGTVTILQALAHWVAARVL
jgi:hypothetical protein